MTARASGQVSVSLRNRGAVVTGAGGGIGAAVAGVLAEAGARVASVDLPGRPGPDGTRSFEADLSDPAQVRDLFIALDSAIGRPDVVVHAAGATRDRVLWKMEDADWSDVLRANLDSAFYVLREAGTRLRDGNGGSIVLITSINGERGKFGQGNYAASKAGLIGLGRSAARELGRHGVRVNLVAPGLIATPMTEGLPEEFRQRAIEETALGRIGSPGDIAGAVLFLVSDLSGHVTGQILRVDGGQLMA